MVKAFDAKFFFGGANNKKDLFYLYLVIYFIF